MDYKCQHIDCHDEATETRQPAGGWPINFCPDHAAEYDAEECMERERE